MHGIVGQPRGIVGVLVAQRETVDALAEQVREGVVHLAGLAPVLEASGQRVDQPQPAIGGLE